MKPHCLQSAGWRFAAARPAHRRTRPARNGPGDEQVAEGSVLLLVPGGRLEAGTFGPAIASRKPGGPRGDIVRALLHLGAIYLDSVVRPPAESLGRPGRGGADAPVPGRSLQIREYIWLTLNLLREGILRTGKLSIGLIRAGAVGQRDAGMASRSLSGLLGSPTTWPGSGMIGPAAALVGLPDGEHQLVSQPRSL